jgi:hypothetical protein
MVMIDRFVLHEAIREVETTKNQRLHGMPGPEHIEKGDLPKLACV